LTIFFTSRQAFEILKFHKFIRLSPETTLITNIRIKAYMLAKKIVNIEVVGTCNLRCPSCPVGNYGDNRWSGNTKGVMEPELFLKIMQKVRTDFNPLETCIALYSWGEPLIHPKIGKLVEIAKSTGFKVNLSSNLNYIRHLPDALAAGVDEIVVSLSGMHADTYETTHRGGNVENLIANLRELARLRSLLTSPPPPSIRQFPFVPP
jgi:MoaA/NifB/PqqE/SkfB family radical SAM enzyme